MIWLSSAGTSEISAASTSDDDEPEETESTPEMVDRVPELQADPQPEGQPESQPLEAELPVMAADTAPQDSTAE